MSCQQNPWVNENFVQITPQPVMPMQQPILGQEQMLLNRQMNQGGFQGAFTPPPFYAPQTPPSTTAPTTQQIPSPGMLPMEMSFIENILRLNRGKRVKVFMTYENNPRWPAVTYEGIIEEAGRDHIVVSDPETGKWYLLLMVNLDYVEFDEPITYEYPFGTAIPLANYSPR